MQVRNIHSRELAASAQRVGALLDGLASANDRLWPRDRWPRMAFDRPLGVGAVGGHGPVRYTVEAYEPGRSVRFRFTGPSGFNGTHRLDVESLSAERSRLVHTIQMTTTGRVRVTWPLVFGPLHDALLEDALDRAERSLGLVGTKSRWSPWVRLLRRLLPGNPSRPRR